METDVLISMEAFSKNIGKLKRSFQGRDYPVGRSVTGQDNPLFRLRRGKQAGNLLRQYFRRLMG